MRAEPADGSCDQRLQPFALRNFARNGARHRPIRGALHQAERFAHTVVGIDLEKRRLLERNRKRHLQRAVEHRLAGRVHEIGKNDRVLPGQT